MRGAITNGICSEHTINCANKCTLERRELDWGSSPCRRAAKHSRQFFIFRSVSTAVEHEKCGSKNFHSKGPENCLASALMRFGVGKADEKSMIVREFFTENAIQTRRTRHNLPTMVDGKSLIGWISAEKDHEYDAKEGC